MYIQPERIEPPDPEKPDYDIRADVWALGISLVCDWTIDFSITLWVMFVSITSKL